MDFQQAFSLVRDGHPDLSAYLAKLYPANGGDRKRILSAMSNFSAIFGSGQDIKLFSAPGRTEICGNHTDHQNGRAVVMSVDLDVIAVVAAVSEQVIRIQSEGHPENIVDLSDLEPKESEKENSTALVRGVCDAFVKQGKKVGGFVAYTTSTIPSGAGLSSSAAFEVLAGQILNVLYNESAIPITEIAKYSMYAENVYYGKPCGLLDQLGCACGGLSSVNFVNPTDPVIRSIDFDFNQAGYSICILDTGGSHADLTPEYAAVRNEMNQISKEMSAETLIDTTRAEILDNLPVLRQKYGDRAVLRSLNFFDETDRAGRVAQALELGDISSFRRLILRSGDGSFRYLQNVVPTGAVRDQGLALALYMAEDILTGRGAWRVHGGGFAGTVQAYVPGDLLQEFVTRTEAVFGEGNCHVVHERRVGVTEILPII